MAWLDRALLRPENRLRKASEAKDVTCLGHQVARSFAGKGRSSVAVLPHLHPPRNLLLGTSASLLVTGALLVVTRTLLRTKGIATSNRCLTSSNKKLLGASASLLVTGALLVVTRSY